MMNEKNEIFKKEENVLATNPFFIFGCPRSGTSLLSRILNHHPNIAVPYESHLFNTFYPSIRLYGDLSDVNNQKRLVKDILSTDVISDWRPQLSQDYIISQITRNDFGGIVEAVIGGWANIQGKKHWGEKTPHHIYYRKDIFRYFPEAKIIHIIRDGRDVTLSLKKARFGPKTTFKCSQFWEHYIQEFEKLKNECSNYRVMEIYYEDLVQQPTKVIREICFFLEEKFTEEMLSFYKNSSDYPTDAENRKNLKNPILRSNIKKWQESMNDADIQIFELVAGNRLVAHGYTLSEMKLPELSMSKRIYYDKIEHVFPRIRAMMINTKGHKDWLIRFRIFTQLRLLSFWKRLRNFIKNR